MEPVLYDPQGRPIRTAETVNCPDCGRGPADRVPSCGFGGDIHLICPCGREFKEQKWQAKVLS